MNDLSNSKQQVNPMSCQIKCLEQIHKW